MATRVLPFAVTIPPGTTPAAPFTQALSLDNWEIERIDLEVPPGPAGLMGFQVYNNGVAWIPYGTGSWLVWDDHSETYYMTDQPTGAGWSIVGYNEGFYPHTVTVRVHVNPTSAALPAAAAPTVTFVQSELPSAEPITLG